MKQTSYCALHDTYPKDDEPCWACINQFSDVLPNAGVENRQNTKPCRVDKKTPCVQYPDDDCGCNPCEDCEVALKFAQENKDS